MYGNITVTNDGSTQFADYVVRTLQVTLVCVVCDMDICVHVYYMCVYVIVYVCMYLCMYVCLCMCVCVCTLRKDNIACM